MEPLIGRKREILELERALSSQRSEFVILYGRRRIGKTFLVRRFFNDRYSFHYVGAHKLRRDAQLANFRDALIRYSKADVPQLTCWRQAFHALADYLEQCPDSRKVVFFDEMPWMDNIGSDFVREFEYFWASWAQNRDDVLFIGCGSATAWMRDKLESNRGGLHNRITRRIYLRPFYLSECRDYLAAHGFDWDYYQIIQCYMLLGGVPFYLSLLRPDLSLPQNIDHLIYERAGSLRTEFEELYHALFNKADRYIDIVKLLATKRQGFTREEIEHHSAMSGGTLTRILSNLERCDFIISYAQFGNKKKQTIYRLADFYTLFYLKFVANNRSNDEQYWQHHFMDRSVESWQGFTFEEVCLQHLPQIKQALGISGMATETSTWRYSPTETNDQKGAQIDLVIKRVDKIVHLVEIKFAERPYTITADYRRRLEERRNLFMDATGITRGVVITFITPMGVAPSANASIMHGQITAKHLFADLM